ncbi:MAG: hypothetical protein SH868_00475 [Bythopirellula sp.]|nr:hypothetical protein [Bythopirellula sp.]
MISFLFSIIICIVALAILTWTAGAIYFDVGHASVVGGLFALLWVAAALGMFVLWQPPWKPFLLLLVFSGCFLWWWLSRRPSFDRPWDPLFAQLPRVTMQGDSITIDHVRNAEYRIDEVATPRYETRSYHLSELCGRMSLR